MKQIKLVSFFVFLILLAGGTGRVYPLNFDIFQAIKKHDLSSVKTILEKDITNLEKLDENKYSPLHLACEIGDIKIVQYLVQKGAKINIKNHQENTPLHLASSKNHFPVVKFLVSRGADVNKKNFRGRIPALRAIVYKSESKLIQYLINNKTDLNTKDFNRSTLLSRACERRYPEIVDLLLKKNIKLPAQQDRIFNLIYYSVFIDHLKLFNLLLEKNPDIKLKDKEESLVRWAAQNGSIKALNLFVKEKFILHTPNKYGNTAIHIAARGGFKSVVKLLLDNGVDINIKNTIGKTALHFAKDNDKKDLVKFLVQNGANQKPYAFPILKGYYLEQELPNNLSKVFAPGIVSVEGLEHSPPVFSRDGNQVFWAADVPTKIMGMIYKKGHWSQPRTMPFNSGMGDSEPVLSYDNNKLFFLSLRTMDGRSKSERERIWYVNRLKNGWSAAKCLNKNANLYPMHWTISIDKEDSIGRKDIFKIKIISGNYQKPQNLGTIINSKLDETTPFIAPDQSYLVYSIRGHPQGKGLTDLFVSFKKSKEEWSKPQNLGESINTPGHELSPVVTPDGKFLFFIRGTDIYWVSAKIIEELKPKDLK